jgi:hypothetical protein
MSKVLRPDAENIDGGFMKYDLETLGTNSRMTTLKNLAIHRNCRAEGGFTARLFAAGVLLSVGLMGCGSSMQSTQNPSQPDSKTSQDGPPTENPGTDYTKQPVPASVDVTSFISQGSYDKVQVVELDPLRKDLILRLPLGLNQFIVLASGELPNLPGITFATEILPSGQARLSIRIPLKYVLRGVKNLESKKLPNGDPLPGVSSGELPGLALALDSSRKVQMSLYLGADFVGIFVESPFDPVVGLAFPIKNAKGNKYVGLFSMIPAKHEPDFQGGFFISYQLPPEISAVLDKYVFPK